MKLFLLAITSTLVAQTIDIQSLYQPAPLAGVWKQHLGDDDLRYADPTFDDSGWTHITMPRPSLPGPRGITWYRFRVHLPEPLPGESLSILIGPLFPAYEIFANGRKIGQFGGPLGDQYGQLYARPVAFSIPRETDLLIAIRSEDWNREYGAQSGSAQRSLSWIGTAPSLADKASAWQLQRKEGTEPLRVAAIILFAGSLFFIFLALIRQRDFEYLWIGIFLIGNSLFRFVQLVPEWLGNPDRATAGWYAVAFLLPTTFALLLFCQAIYKLNLDRIIWSAVGVLLIVYASMVPPIGDWFRTHHLSLGIWQTLLANLGELTIYSNFAWRARGQPGKFWPIHLAFGVYVGANLVFYSIQTLTGRGVSGGGDLALWEIGLRSAIVFLLFAMGLYLSQRSAASDQEQGRLQQELTAAAEVQSLMLAAPSAANADTTVESVYLPASEVGGDFYHVQRYPDGSQVALVGDVSGKGLKAAMLVSVAIGALRREESSSPGLILKGLNDALAGRGGAGFVTCCCVRYAPGGTVTIASAGHPAPYCGGREIEVAAGLPVGIVAGSTWEETSITLTVGDQLTLVSDGVVEAENSKRELFGFDRTRDISGKSAQQIANAARAWGQNDDITVVTMRRVG